MGLLPPEVVPAASWAPPTPRELLHCLPAGGDSRGVDVIRGGAFGIVCHSGFSVALLVLVLQLQNQPQAEVLKTALI